jgi:hypothetical protein
MTLAVLKPDGLDMGVAIQRPGESGRGILASGKEHEGTIGLERRRHPAIMAAIGGPVTRCPFAKIETQRVFLNVRRMFFAFGRMAGPVSLAL